DGQTSNMQMLALQQQIQEESQRFTTVSNVMRAKYDTAKAAVSNIRAYRAKVRPAWQVRSQDRAARRPETSRSPRAAQPTRAAPPPVPTPRPARDRRSPTS